MRLNTEVLDREKVLLILQWCVNNFGKSRYWKKPLKLRVYKSKGRTVTGDIITFDDGVRGCYNKGRISIFLDTIGSAKELCETVIHEYHHYLMSDREYRRFEKELNEKYEDKKSAYKKHPHEIIASKAEEKWGNICFNELRNKLYKKN